MEIQKSLYLQLQSGDVGQNFFRVFHDSMQAAQAEIKSTVTVNTSDIAARAHEENNNNNNHINQAGVLKNSKGKYVNGNLIMTEELKDELDVASHSTQQAYLAVRGGAGGSQGMYSGIQNERGCTTYIAFNYLALYSIFILNFFCFRRCYGFGSSLSKP